MAPLAALPTDHLSTDPHKPKVAAGAPQKDWWVEVVTDRAQLGSREKEWTTLAREAVASNVFHEPWMMLPAVQTYGRDEDLSFAFLYRRDPRPKHGPQLCGFFPLVREKRSLRRPFRVLSLWRHPYAVLCTPLLHREWSRETLHAFLDWVAAQEPCALLNLPMIHGDGEFRQTLIDVLNQRRLQSFVQETWNRALIVRGADAESYCVSAMNHLSRKEWNRQRRRLGEQGNLETRILHPHANADPWIEQFLALEASGWKGESGTALTINEESRDFFRAIARAARERQQLQMLGLWLNDEPIALKCNFLAGGGAFAFKIAFDERYSKWSPGVQLELDNIAAMHQRDDIAWMDSCAVPNHPMINRLWKERRTIETRVISMSRFAGNAVVGFWPMYRAMKRMIWG